ncbi:MAG: DUF1828 domain-containing protein [Bacteroidales bacterium]|nr:DUF1828 domain-containing protein [Bacteroidales bacterium]
MKENIIAQLTEQFNGRLKVNEKRQGIYQLFLPLYHEDGDMIEIYLEKVNEQWRISDYAMALMRLSYSYKVDTENKEKIFQKIISENGLSEENGVIFINANDEQLYPSILQFATGISKVTSMRYFKREVIESLFYELLDEYIFSDLQSYKPEKNVLPINERDDLEADYAFHPNGYPVYLFGVKDVPKARLAAICCLEFQKQSQKFRSYVVHEDFEKLSKKDRARLTSACDKQFISLNDFKENSVKFLEREK